MNYGIRVTSKHLIHTDLMNSTSRNQNWLSLSIYVYIFCLVFTCTYTNTHVCIILMEQANSSKQFHHKVNWIPLYAFMVIQDHFLTISHNFSESPATFMKEIKTRREISKSAIFFLAIVLTPTSNKRQFTPGKTALDQESQENRRNDGLTLEG